MKIYKSRNLRELTCLTIQEKLEFLREIRKSLQKDYRVEMEKAVEEMRDEYLTNRELTVFTDLI